MRNGAMDPRSALFYLQDPALTQRAYMAEWLQRYGTAHPMPRVSPASVVGAKESAAARPDFSDRFYFRAFASRKPILFCGMRHRKRLPSSETT